MYLNLPSALNLVWMRQGAHYKIRYLSYQASHQKEHHVSKTNS